MRSLPILILLALPVHAIGFANGIKIGEVSDTGAIIWTRLTERAEADRRVDAWDEEKPMPWSVPGAEGALTLEVRAEGGSPRVLPVTTVTSATDFAHQFRLTDLQPATRYFLNITGEGSDGTATILGSFRTAPAPSTTAPLTFVISTCQDFPRRDDKANGHVIYKSMLALDPAFFIQTGDTLYYDKPHPFARDLATARFKWNRLYALPNLRTFHRQVPSYWLKDDHDLLKNDCWPGQNYGELTWDQGLQIWREQVPQSDKPYRTFRWGKDLQVWFPEGREFRSPNKMADGPAKTIFGEEQWQWLRESMRSSEATHKLFVSATPVVGPDRKNKRDNHSNEGFAHEGGMLRKFLSSVPGCLVINGDRHWQYHSMDPKTGLSEFGSGPASDVHAGGWSPNNKLPPHQFLRVKGGFLSGRVEEKTLTIRHHDVSGAVVYEHTVQAGAHAESQKR